MTQALIGLGSNIEPRRDLLRLALKRLDEAPLKLLSASSLYETEPMDVLDQASFLNMAACVECELSADALLDRLQAIEAEAGKQVTLRRGPRTLDLDLWAYGSLEIESERLSLPHPRISQRPFVLLPLIEIAPEWRHPQLKMTAAEMLDLIPKPWPSVAKLGALG